MAAFVVQIKNATVYIKDTKALSNVNWTVRPAENWAIVGNNGSGKSTLLKLVFGDLLPMEGGVVHWFNKKSWAGLMDIREKVGYVSAEFQDNYDQNITVQQVVESGWFSSVGLWDKVSQTQKQAALVQMGSLGILPLRHQRFKDLSYGEARRVLLARALVIRPSMLVLDEPCAGLDIPTRERFLETLQKIARRVRLIYVTHHVEEILPAITHVLLLKGGRVHNQGFKRQMLTEENLSSALGCQVTVEKRNGRTWLTGVSR